MRTPPISVDLDATRRRTQRLKRYVENHLLVGGEFICSQYPSCYASRRPTDSFYEGTMSHIGRRYDLLLGDKPLRIVVIGQEAGSEHFNRVTMADRYHHVYQQSGIESRYNAEPGYPSRNPHMRGTTSALRVIFGKGLGKDHAGEWVKPENDSPFHIFDGFALVNRLLCFAGPAASRQGRGTKTMLANCGKHLAATLSRLEPTILIVQGKQAASGPASILSRGRTYSENVHEAFLGEQRMVVCELSHPSARAERRWGDRLDAPYLTNTVVPSIRIALRHS